MSVTFASLKLKVNDTIQTFKLGDKDIEVKQYLSTKEKEDLIAITMQSAQEGNLYSPLKLETYFHLYLVMEYTNITFTEKQREDLLKLYDILQTNGVIEQVISLIPAEEYSDLLGYLDDYTRKTEAYNASVGGVVKGLIDTLPLNAEEALNIVNGFDPNKFSDVMNFAKAVGYNGKFNPITQDENSN